MEKLDKLKEYYRFTVQDELRLRTVQPLMVEHLEPCMAFLHERMAKRGGLEQIYTPDRMDFLRSWFISLFGEGCSEHLYQRLIAFGKAHAKANIPSHVITLAVSAVRECATGVVLANLHDPQGRTALISSLNKLLDLNLELMAGACEEEIASTSKATMVKRSLIGFAEKFTRMMDFVLVLLLIAITFGVLLDLLQDLFTLFTGKIEHSVISALGTLLVLWVMIELMNTEIEHLKGAKINISVFVGVVFVSIIRDLLINTLENKTQTGYYLVVVTVSLGVVYWLIKKTEDKKSS